MWGNRKGKVGGIPSDGETEDYTGPGGLHDSTSDLPIYG